MAIQSSFTLHYMRETISRAFFWLRELFYKVDEVYENVLLIYFHLLSISFFKRDPSMTVTVLLFSVWLHNVQVPICCFFRRRKEASFSIS